MQHGRRRLWSLPRTAIIAGGRCVRRVQTRAGEKKAATANKLEEVFSILHQKQSVEGILGANATLSIDLSALCSLVLL